MIPAAFEYAAPRSLEEALELLDQHADDGKLLAGGHSLIPLMKLRLATPTFLVDLGTVPKLAYITDAGDHVAIGAMTTHHMLESSDLLRERLPLLAQAASTVGDMQVRNRGTLGGSLSHADPASDLPAVVTALGGEVIACSSHGERSIPISEFFQDIWTSALQPVEIVTEIRVPYGRGNPAQAYEKFRQRVADWAIVGVAVNVERANGAIERVSVVLTNVGSTPVRAFAVEAALQGGSATVETVERASELAAEGLDPSTELRASPDYKRHLARVLTRRALSTALHLA